MVNFIALHYAQAPVLLLFRRIISAQGCLVQQEYLERDPLIPEKAGL